MPIPKEMGEENGSNRRHVKGTGNGSLSHLSDTTLWEYITIMIALERKCKIRNVQ